MSKNRFASVWDAIEGTHGEAGNMKLRSTLMIALKVHLAHTDLSQAQPALTVEAQNGGVMQIYFAKPHAEGVHIQCKLDGQADYSLLASATHSPFVDNRPPAVAGKPETRSYRAIYFYGTAEFGLMSAVVVATAIP